MEIGKNLKKAGIKFISSIDLQPGQVEFNENGESKITVSSTTTQGFGEATSETQKKLEDMIISNESEEVSDI